MKKKEIAMLRREKQMFAISTSHKGRKEKEETGTNMLEE